MFFGKTLNITKRHFNYSIFLKNTYNTFYKHQFITHKINILRPYSATMTAITYTRYNPPVNRSMIELDRDFFKRDFPVVAAFIPDPKNIGPFMKKCRVDILDIPKFHIVTIQKDNKPTKVVLLDYPTIEDAKKSASLETLSALNEFNVELQSHIITLDYSCWKTEDILHSVLPIDLLDGAPATFAMTGHVAHINLRDEYLPYKKLIGQVILDKNPTIKTVVNKVDNIATKFRTFKMEVLVGDTNLDVEKRESDCIFQFNYSQVYWNSKLHTEHERLVKKFKPFEIVGDVFAGVGPFAVPGGKKKVVVLANDLNPHSYESLKNNIKLNKVGKFVFPFNQDGAEFIKNSVSTLKKVVENNPKLFIDEPKPPKRHSKRQKLEPNSKEGADIESVAVERIAREGPKLFEHFVMNLPDSAITFLHHFIGIYDNSYVRSIRDSNLSDFTLPFIHVHCFQKHDVDEKPSKEEIQKRIWERIVDELQFEIPIQECEFHHVRDVAPTKPMYCVSFKLPEEVAFRQKSSS